MPMQYLDLLCHSIHCVLCFDPTSTCSCQSHSHLFVMTPSPEEAVITQGCMLRASETFERACVCFAPCADLAMQSSLMAKQSVHPSPPQKNSQKNPT